MAIIVSQVKTTLEESSNQDRIWEAARKTARLKPEEIKKTYLVKSSIDARKQDHILLVSSVGFELKHPEEESLEQLMRREQEVLKRTQNSRNGQFVKIQHNPPPVSYTHLFAVSAFGTPPLYLSARRVATTTIADGARPA